MLLVISFFISAISFLVANYNKKEKDKIGTWVWRIAGIAWGIGTFFELVVLIQ